jgi:hypothetical protein
MLARRKPTTVETIRNVVLRLQWLGNRRATAVWLLVVLLPALGLGSCEGGTTKPIPTPLISKSATVLSTPSATLAGVVALVQTPTLTATEGSSATCNPLHTSWNANDGAGYRLCYPQNWHPPDTTYANAFEIRNYPSQQPESVEERNRASLVVVDTRNDDAAASSQFLDQLLTQENDLPSDQRAVTVDGFRAVRVYRRVPAAQLGPGVATPSSTAVPLLLRFAVYIAQGNHVFSLEGVLPEGADPGVIQELKDIEGGIQMLTGPP